MTGWQWLAIALYANAVLMSIRKEIVWVKPNPWGFPGVVFVIVCAVIDLLIFYKAGMLESFI